MSDYSSDTPRNASTWGGPLVMLLVGFGFAALNRPVPLPTSAHGFQVAPPPNQFVPEQVPDLPLRTADVSAPTAAPEDVDDDPTIVAFESSSAEIPVVKRTTYKVVANPDHELIELPDVEDPDAPDLLSSAGDRLDSSSNQFPEALVVGPPVPAAPSIGEDVLAGSVKTDDGNRRVEAKKDVEENSLTIATPDHPTTTARPFLGVGLRDTSSSLVTSLHRRTAAAKMGVRVGDQLLAVGSESVVDLKSLRVALSHYNVGDLVQLKVLRRGQAITLDPEELSAKP